MKIPFLVSRSPSIDAFTEISPCFPNWEKSFISGPDSPLYEVRHLISNDDPTLLLTRVKFKDKAEGPGGHVHGGASAALIDEVMGVIVWHQKKPALTQALNLHYLKALPLKQEAFLFSKVVSTHVKTVEAHTTIYSGDSDAAFVTAQGIFHPLTEEQLQRFSKRL